MLINCPNCSWKNFGRQLKKSSFERILVDFYQTVSHCQDSVNNWDYFDHTTKRGGNGCHKGGRETVKPLTNANKERHDQTGAADKKRDRTRGRWQSCNTRGRWWCSIEIPQLLVWQMREAWKENILLVWKHSRWKVSRFPSRRKKIMYAIYGTSLPV